MDITRAFQAGRDFMRQRQDDMERAKNAVGGAIDGAVESGEKHVDDFRKDVVAFGKEHGGVAGQVAGQMVSDAIGFEKGKALALYETGKGLVQLADATQQLTNPVEWIARPDRQMQRIGTGVQVADTLATFGSPPYLAAKMMIDPKGTIDKQKAMVDGLTSSYQQAYKDGDYSEIAGRAVFDIGSMFIPGGAGAGAKGASVSGRAASAGAKVAPDVAAAASHVPPGGLTRGATGLRPPKTVDFTAPWDLTRNTMTNRLVIGPNGVLDVLAHGSRRSVQIFSHGVDVTLNAKQLAQHIRNIPGYYQGQPVRLISCSTGAYGLGNSFAKRLANELGATVHAPSSLIWANSNPVTRAIAPAIRDAAGNWVPDLARSGKMRTFQSNAQIAAQVVQAAVPLAPLVPLGVVADKVFDAAAHR